MTAAEQSSRMVLETVVEELVSAFDCLPPELVADVVLAAERDLTGQVAPGSLGELLHRLAAYRLEQLAGRQ